MKRQPDLDVGIELHNRIVLFGGFPAGGGDCEDRDPGRYDTVLSGDLGAVRARRVDSSAVLDGFVIESKRGSALTILGASPTIRNCSLTAGELNIAALTVRSTNDVISAPRFLACTVHIEEHTAAIDENAEPVFIACMFAADAGIGIGDSAVVLDGTCFSGPLPPARRIAR
jgi:hypothetical protein